MFVICVTDGGLVVGIVVAEYQFVVLILIMEGVGLFSDLVTQSDEKKEKKLRSVAE